MRAYNSEGECIWVLQPFKICNFKIFFLIYYKKLSKNGHFNSEIDNFRSMLKKSIFFATDTFIRHKTSKAESGAQNEIFRHLLDDAHLFTS